MHRTLFPSPRRARIALAAAALIAVSIVSACSRQPLYPPPPISGGEIAIDIASLHAEVPQFFTLSVSGRPVSFFVIRMNNGAQAYFDACVTCYPQKRGYAYRDNRVICRKCNMDFSIYKLDKGVGGCYPIKLQGRTEGGRFLIPITAIEAEAGKF